ncbi:hypothetical protein HCB17_25360 [Salinispora arenicola]|uniref:hypothetical protein n=1 Tax=Salinispora arenicola TaxID=168697 RepID=UPI0014321028|nr:hypothetical protein [Salinispora arenicola]NIL44068.1 hypothetical protein [Salinispora arenicola]
MAGWMLIRRSIADPDDLAFYLCAGPATTGIDTLVRVAGARRAVDQCFQQAKTETGLDHYQVRRYQPWYRHITLAILAHAYLAVTAAGNPSSRDLVRVSPDEIRRLLAHLIHGVNRSFDRIAARSHLRHRYQARAKRSHYQRSTTDTTKHCCRGCLANGVFGDLG